MLVPFMSLIFIIMLSFLVIKVKKNTMDFYTSPQPTDYVKKVYKKKVNDGGAAAAASVSIDKYATEPQFHEEEPLDEPFSFTLPSGYGWEDN